MVRSFLFFLALCLCLVACGDNSPAPTLQSVLTFEAAAQPTFPPTPSIQLSPSTSVNPRSPQDEDNIRETILRYRFAQVASSSGAFPPNNFYCLGFETTSQSASNLQDLPQTLLNRFQGNNPPVRKASDCIFNQDKVVVKNSGEPAMFWGIGTVNWISDNKAELEISLLYAFNGTEGTLFQLERENGSWKVTGSTMTWIA